MAPSAAAEPVVGPQRGGAASVRLELGRGARCAKSSRSYDSRNLEASMFRRTARLPAVAVAGMLLAALMAPTAANAWAVGGATLVGNYCMPSSLTWKGDVRYESRSGNPAPHQTTGTAKYCVNWYRINDADPAADYYMLTVRVTWTVTYKWSGSSD